jgi:hypothetical protein
VNGTLQLTNGFVVDLSDRWSRHFFSPPSTRIDARSEPKDALIHTKKKGGGTTVRGVRVCRKNPEPLENGKACPLPG